MMKSTYKKFRARLTFDFFYSNSRERLYFNKFVVFIELILLNENSIAIFYLYDMLSKYIHSTELIMKAYIHK